jgi:KAP family P-loop domain
MCCDWSSSWKVIVGASPPQQKRAPSGEGWADAFLRLLNNREKARRGGFAVVVKAPQSLQTLQALCLQQSWNQCLTARYRLQGEPVFGTLLAAFLSDLSLWQNDKPFFRGDILPEYGRSDWGDWIAAFVDEVCWSGPPSEQAVLAESAGAVEPELLERFLAAADRSLTTGRRLVLFGEVAAPTGRAEWKKGFEGLIGRLPERVGVVLSGPPTEFQLPVGDPRFLELDEVPVDVEAGREAYRYRLSALVADRPAPTDLLGVGRFAEALARLVLLPETGAMTIGVHGPWGQGKSSFMQFVERALVLWAPANHAGPKGPPARGAGRSDGDDLPAELRELDRQLDESAAPGLPPHRREALLLERSRLWERMVRRAAADIVTVRFNAWQFEDATQIWAGLAHAITERFEATLPWWARLWTRVLYAWSRRRAQLVVDLALPALAAAAFAVLLAIVGADRLEAWTSSSQLDDVSRVALPTSVAVAGFLWFVARRAHSVLRPVSDRVLEYGRMPDYREQMGFQHEVQRDLLFARDRLGRRRLFRRRGPRPRVVVFIDDLDRCSDEKIIDTLQAINLILGPEASGFYVFLGIDTEMVERAIKSRYATDAALPAQFAERYLRKIIQLSFRLPHSLPEELFHVPNTTPKANLITHLFSQAARVPPQREDGEQGDSERPQDEERPAADEGSLRFDHSVLREPVVEVLKEVEDTPDELSAFIELQEFLGDNPRELKRLVNVHRLVKIILQRPDVPATPEHQRKLVKWLVFCARWPDLIDDVLDCAAKGVQGDCVETLRNTRAVPPANRSDLTSFAAQEPQLTAEDLKPSGPLAFAAQISTLALPEPLPELTSDVVEEAAAAVWADGGSGVARRADQGDGSVGGD